MPECEVAFIEFKKYFSNLSILCKPEVGQPLHLYLLVTSAVIATALSREDSRQKHSVYFVSKAL